jgi:hypothetical protein
MPDIQHRSATVLAEVLPILRTAGVHKAAEQFVGAIVNILSESVVGPQRQSAAVTVDEVYRCAVVNSLAGCWESRYQSTEAVSSMDQVSPGQAIVTVVRDLPQFKLLKLRFHADSIPSALTTLSLCNLRFGACPLAFSRQSECT